MTGGGVLRECGDILLLSIFLFHLVLSLLNVVKMKQPCIIVYKCTNASSKNI